MVLLVQPALDEVLIHIGARYAAACNFPNRRTANRHFFGRLTGKSILDLPNRIRVLATSLPPGNVLDAIYFLDKHTLYPFYKHFLPEKRVTELRENMLGDGAKDSHVIVSITSCHIELPQNFMYCPY